jgi:hypothetical protein
MALDSYYFENLKSHQNRKMKAIPPCSSEEKKGGVIPPSSIYLYAIVLK